MSRQKTKREIETQNKPGGILSPKVGNEKPAAVDDTIDKPVDDTIDKPVDDAETIVNRKTKIENKKVIYAFPTQSRCLRCGTTDTTAYATKGRIQYRRCLRAICRHTYTVTGQKI